MWDSSLNRMGCCNLNSRSPEPFVLHLQNYQLGPRKLWGRREWERIWVPCLVLREDTAQLKWRIKGLSPDIWMGPGNLLLNELFKRDLEGLGTRELQQRNRMVQQSHLLGNEERGNISSPKRVLCLVPPTLASALGQAAGFTCWALSVVRVFSFYNFNK